MIPPVVRVSRKRKGKCDQEYFLGVSCTIQNLFEQIYLGEVSFVY